MRVTKRMVCLANSRKRNGRCIAGRELIGDKQTRGEWIRPISNRPGEEVSERERQYEDGSDPNVLDVIDVPLLEAKPRNYQRENWLLDDKHYWRKHSLFDQERLKDLLDPVAPLWINGESTYHGTNDRVKNDEVNQEDGSLRFIRLGKLTVHVFAPGEAFGNVKRRVHAEFLHNQESYKLWITDPKYEKKYLKMENGRYEIGDCFATISLGEEHDDGYFYKLVAAIMEIPDAGG